MSILEELTKDRSDIESRLDYHRTQTSIYQILLHRLDEEILEYERASD